ncbi:MAG: AAA family ATPase [Elusimicrobia bacterium]|nr:AAA family ATPase [Candidatus Obscuribacterium magneticum]
MNFEEEISLLVKSRYTLVLVDTIDEDYVMDQLYRFAEEQSLMFYSWSLTKGLRVGRNQNSFYKTGEAVSMLKIANSLIQDTQNAIFAFCDFDRFLEDAAVSRLFKDLLSGVKDTPSTVVLIGAEGKLPADIAPLSARISGGYPDERQILNEVNRTVSEFKLSGVSLEVNMPPESLRRVVKILKGLSLQQVRNALNRCLIKDCRFDVADIVEMEKFKKEAFDREGILEYFGSEQKNAIAGFENLKHWINDRKNSFFNEGPLPPPKGLLLLGVQGCGKSLAAKVIAGELGIPLYRLDLNRLYSKYIGETEENLRKALATVERLAPVCLWIDEIEKILAASSGEADGGVSQRVLGTMLTWMQERKDRSFITATSNDINSLPPELLRKGRFDEIFFSDLPDAAGREAIIKIHLKKRGLEPGLFDVSVLAKNSGGFSGAEIEQAVISALYSASGANEKISSKHVLEQIRLTRPLSIIKSEDVNFLRDWAKQRGILPV